VLGPRQCGKTTFIRQALPDWTHLDLERPSDVTPLLADPEARLGQLGDRIILDEAQRVPEIFPVLRGLIDRRRPGKGRFVLLGSASPTPFSSPTTRGAATGSRPTPGPSSSATFPAWASKCRPCR
jgi:predicted AAA+ superfamily ATPase